MIDIENESLLSLSEATRALPAIDGQRPHVSTIIRWTRKGLRGGIKLETARIGRRVVTSREALHRFSQALTEAEAATPSQRPVQCRKPRTQSQREHDLARSSAALDAMGIGGDVA